MMHGQKSIKFVCSSSLTFRDNLSGSILNGQAWPLNMAQMCCVKCQNTADLKI